MITYVLRRLLYSIPVLIAASLLIFFSVSAMGDPLAELKINPLLSKQTVHNIEQRNHLDKPIIVQYGYWVKTAVTDKFGSPLLIPGEHIWNDLRRVLPHTLQLIFLSEIFALIFGIGIGVYSAIRQYSFFDYVATSFSFLGFAMPVFWLALMLQIAFTDIFIKWHVRIFYTSGLSSENPGSGIHFWVDRFQHLALPALTLMVLSIAQYSRFMRASMLEVINSDYVRTARAKGLVERRVTLKHAFRNALIPLVTVSAINFGALIGGAVITETIFQLDGMGPYFIQNLFSRDTYAVMAWLMITATAVILFNLIADILYGYIDPRIRYE
ncbi:MAG: ABC transporter permease [Actinobacteria bacterium]|nr:MAG: ABC transporter permease [Actinomycetota bacterium]